MTEDRKSNLDKLTSAAGTVQGAIKTGKALAGAAKGSALGPYGLAAAFIIEHRKVIAKAILAITFVFILPILYMLMLPSLIFGDLSLSSQALNDNSLIADNISQAETTIARVLSAAHQQIINEINEAIASLGENEIAELVDNYQEQIFFNSTLLISQYCASKEDYQEINLTDLEQVIADNAHGLFSYTITSDSRTEADDTITTIYTYTVTYNGDDYFADNIFALDNEQKILAEEYGHNLAIFLDEDYLNNVKNTQRRLSEYIADNPYSPSGTESFGSPFPDIDWYSAISSHFGYRIDPITNEQGKFHSGLDIALPLGTPIQAAMSGKVLFVIEQDSGYGYHTAINHGNGIVTLYAHCSKLLVREGQIVSKGAIIAEVGSTGRSTGNHLHFEVIINDEHQNPLDYIY